MSEIQKEQIKKIVYTFTRLANVNDENICNDLINRLSLMSESDVIDYLVVALNDLAENKQIKKDDIFANIDLITSLSEKYPTTEDLLSRLNWLKSMNMTHPQMPLTENHKLVIETFDKFNQIIGTNFDAYYTGGLMGYLATNHPLERYHSDLDLFINESQLGILYDVISQSEEFEFVSNMNHKEKNGHEFKIQYRGTPMSIGLFLFERQANDEVVLKEYYHSNNNISEELLVDERHLSSGYAQMIFENAVKEHNGIPYRSLSLEGIYNSKKNSRPKDKYDANIIRDSVDLMVDYLLDTQKQNNYDIKGKIAKDSIVSQLENIANSSETKKHI